MIVLAEGLGGAGKTYFITKLAFKDWKSGAKIYPNYDLTFSDGNENITRWHFLDETFGLENGVIVIDDAVRLLEARRWHSLPVTFSEKIATHRHEHIDIYTTAQSIKHIDARLRQNIHVLFSCRSIFRIPTNDRVLPIFQIIRIIEKKREIDQNDRLKFKKTGSHWLFMSRFWSPTLYNTFQRFRSSKFICRIIYKNKKWIARIYARDLVNRGKARI